tara:strand:- start:83 stop:616 length:534 start_codon:yes stop_codon:yes gene_type:complete
MFKNISFWCVVLFFVVAMFIHHILSNQPLVEGAQVNMDDVSKLKITLKGPQDFVEKIFKKHPRESEEDLSTNEKNAVVVNVNAERIGGNNVRPPTSSQVNRISSGTCETPITTNEECIAAATAQGLDPPMWSFSPSENSSYPTGCSIPHGIKAHFNTMTTQVECGGGAENADCLCAA